jgi:hypothetical protein
MVAFNFQKQFVTPVETGLKPHTIRALRKRNRKGLFHGEPCSVGESLQLYYGMRTSSSRKLADAICTTVTPIHITQKLDDRHWLYKGEVSGSIITWRKTLLSTSDGFDDFDAMLAWFENTHDLPFKRFLIEWKLV